MGGEDHKDGKMEGVAWTFEREGEGVQPSPPQKKNHFLASQEVRLGHLHLWCAKPGLLCFPSYSSRKRPTQPALISNGQTVGKRGSGCGNPTGKGERRPRALLERESGLGGKRRWVWDFQAAEGESEQETPPPFEKGQGRWKTRPRFLSSASCLATLCPPAELH